MRKFEIRDPIHGFIQIDEWERDIIDHPVFQRLRRIRQLGWSEMVYPGSTHTRFEHSLGVMHVATQMFNSVQDKCEAILEDASFTPGGLQRNRALVRLAALLHDVGHPPFSHAGEGLMPTDGKTGKAYGHEAYSAAAVRLLMPDVIDRHPVNLKNHGIRADEVANLLMGSPSAGGSLIWRHLISSQLDADRADYLLRDAYHCGVEYGRYDLKRLLATLMVAHKPDTGDLTLAVKHSGFHAAEGLIVARYMMFTQVYFQKTRRAYDHHCQNVLSDGLARQNAGGAPGTKVRFSAPDSAVHLQDYLDWDDWRVLGMIAAGSGGEHGRALRERRHHRLVFETSEVPSSEELGQLTKVQEALGDLVTFVDDARKSWYKTGDEDVLIEQDVVGEQPTVVPLSTLSSVVKGLRSVEQKRIYVRFDDREKARRIAKEAQRGGDPNNG